MLVLIEKILNIELVYVEDFSQPDYILGKYSAKEWVENELMEKGEIYCHQKLNNPLIKKLVEEKGHDLTKAHYYLKDWFNDYFIRPIEMVAFKKSILKNENLALCIHSREKAEFIQQIYPELKVDSYSLWFSWAFPIPLRKDHAIDDFIRPCWIP